MSAALVASFAFKLGLASLIGIVCGWQPMPDGSQSYECVVQLEPELVNSLKQGDSIPLSLEVPEHVRPISRIRIVVGRDGVPQQTLATSFKPWPAENKQPRDGVVETQYTTNNVTPNNGYNNYQQPVNGQILPVNQTITDAQNAFARSLQNGGQAVRDNINQATQDILPPDAGQSVSNAIDRAGQQLGNNLQNAGDTVREDIRQMFGAQPTAVGNSQILPPGSSNAPPANNQQAAQIMPADSGNMNTRRRLDQPISAAPPNDWQSMPQTVGTASTQPMNNGGVGNTMNSAQPTNDRYPAFSGSNSNIVPQNIGPQDYRQQSSNNLATADNRNTPPPTEPLRNTAGPDFPAFTPTLESNQPITPTPHQPQSLANVAEIRREMLDQPANAEIQGANGLPIGQEPIRSAAPPVQAVSAPQIPTANDFNWNTKPQAQPQSQQYQQQALDAALAGSAGTFPLLLSWVLLSGSGAGNLYLFWSYLDVRNKYRDLVDDATRRISGRRLRD